jgi:hypothetical protein
VFETILVNTMRCRLHYTALEQHVNIHRRIDSDNVSTAVVYCMLSLLYVCCAAFDAQCDK